MASVVQRIAIFVMIVLMCAPAVWPQAQTARFEDSLVLAPLYVDYAKVSADKFARDALALKQAIGTAPHVLLGFASFLRIAYPSIPLDKPVDERDMAPVLAEADVIVGRARENGLITHISLVSGFFHSHNELRYSAINRDVRNAQWFSDGWIADPMDLTNPAHVPLSVWVTPSRYAQPLHTRIEEGARILGRHLAGLMARFPETLLTISGDGETEFTWVRNLTEEGAKAVNPETAVYADYSPFMVEEFRDWIRASRYAGDATPAADDDGDGRTFNRDFGQSFTTRRLRYFDSSGPIPFADYVRMREKLPSSGPYAIAGGFDAPRVEKDGDPFWTLWMQFRQQVIKNWIREFALWITKSADPATGFEIPPSRFYSHQIPADLIFGEKDNKRLRMSASPIHTAVLEPLGSTGVTAFNGFDGKRHVKTATPELYSTLFTTSDHWGIMEYNPSMPYSNTVAPSNDVRYYINELRLLYNFKPHVIIPFAYTEYAEHKRFSIKGTSFERALRQFVLDVGKTPWFSWRAALR
jgi:hypothetical protein